ncbi:hypothetical protein C8Q74DRAFT_951945 [Fomes fomentarius]|nr:hypothetical protein C8Q74DRAFT_951945 [Fomes fomentarius]
MGGIWNALLADGVTLYVGQSSCQSPSAQSPCHCRRNDENGSCRRRPCPMAGGSPLCARGPCGVQSVTIYPRRFQPLKGEVNNGKRAHPSCFLLFIEPQVALSMAPTSPPFYMPFYWDPAQMRWRAVDGWVNSVDPDVVFECHCIMPQPARRGSGSQEHVAANVLPRASRPHVDPSCAETPCAPVSGHGLGLDTYIHMPAHVPRR